MVENEKAEVRRGPNCYAINDERFSEANWKRLRSLGKSARYIAREDGEWTIAGPSTRVLELRMRGATEYEVWRIYANHVEYRYTKGTTNG